MDRPARRPQARRPGDRARCREQGRQAGREGRLRPDPVPDRTPLGRGRDRRGARRGRAARCRDPQRDHVLRPARGVPRRGECAGCAARARVRRRAGIWLMARPARPDERADLHDRSAGCARLRRRDLNRLGRGAPGVGARRAHRRRRSFRACGFSARPGSCRTRQQHLPAPSRAAHAARGALQRRVLAPGRRGTAHAQRHREPRHQGAHHRHPLGSQRDPQPQAHDLP